MEWGRARLNRRRFGMLQEVGQARPPHIFIAFPTELQFLSITFIRKLCECAHHFLNELIWFHYEISAAAEVPRHKLTLLTIKQGSTESVIYEKICARPISLHH